MVPIQESLITQPLQVGNEHNSHLLLEGNTENKVQVREVETGTGAWHHTGQDGTCHAELLHEKRLRCHELLWLPGLLLKKAVLRLCGGWPAAHPSLWTPSPCLWCPHCELPAWATRDSRPTLRVALDALPWGHSKLGSFLTSPQIFTLGKDKCKSGFPHSLPRSQLFRGSSRTVSHKLLTDLYNSQISGYSYFPLQRK